MKRRPASKAKRKAKRKAKVEPKRRLRSKASSELVAALKRFGAEADAYWAKLPQIPEEALRDWRDRVDAHFALAPAPAPGVSGTLAATEVADAAALAGLVAPAKRKKREPTLQWQITEALLRADHPERVPNTARTAGLLRKIVGVDNKRWNAECERRGVSVPAPTYSSVARVRKSLAY